LVYGHFTGKYDRDAGLTARRRLEGKMDALSDVLRAARFTGGVFLHAELSAPWCFTGRVTAEICSPFLDPASHVIPYHYVLKGACDICIHGEPDKTITVNEGDIVLFPHNSVHTMGSDLGLPPVPASQIIRPNDSGGLHSITHGGDGPVTRLVCGYLGFDNTLGNPIITALPVVLQIDVNEGIGAEWIHSTFRFAADEVAARRLGSEALLAKLSEMLFVEAVRRHASSLPEDRTGWLAGMRDRHVARVLALFHGSVARPWTIEELGREVGLSRSALVDRFTRLIGTTPMQYLTNWRMQLARQMLRNTNASLTRISYEVGYGSDAAFSRAFKKAFGTAPGKQRRGE
jgi:AraC family transcriptional regulator, alkane utilization regulator